MGEGDAGRSGGPPTWPRILGGLILVGAATFALPVSAYVVEAIDEGARNSIVVLHLFLSGAVGGAMGAVWPDLGPRAAPTGRRVLVWGVLGLAAALVAGAVWWVLLTG
jgi:hypothetical protein